MVYNTLSNFFYFHLLLFQIFKDVSTDFISTKQFEENVGKSLSGILGFKANVVNYASFVTTNNRKLLSDAGVTYTVTGSSPSTSETVASLIDSKADTEFKASLNNLGGSSIQNIISFSSAVVYTPSNAPISALSVTQPILKSGKSSQSVMMYVRMYV